MTPRAIHLVLIAALAGCGCTPGGAGQNGGGGARVIFSSSMCGTSSRQPEIAWVGSASALAQVYEQIRRGTIGGRTQTPPPVDFARRAVLWLQMGMQPSAGYGLSLQDQGAAIAADTLTLHVKWLEPAPGRLYAQMVTHPCLLVSVPKGDYHLVEVRDQHGKLRLRTETAE